MAAAAVPTRRIWCEHLKSFHQYPSFLLVDVSSNVFRSTPGTFSSVALIVMRYICILISACPEGNVLHKSNAPQITYLGFIIRLYPDQASSLPSPQM